MYIIAPSSRCIHAVGFVGSRFVTCRNHLSATHTEAIGPLTMNRSPSLNSPGLPSSFMYCDRTSQTVICTAICTSRLRVCASCITRTRKSFTSRGGHSCLKRKQSQSSESACQTRRRPTSSSFSISSPILSLSLAHFSCIARASQPASSLDVRLMIS